MGERPVSNFDGASRLWEDGLHIVVWVSVYCPTGGFMLLVSIKGRMVKMRRKRQRRNLGKYRSDLHFDRGQNAVKMGGFARGSAQRRKGWYAESPLRSRQTCEILGRIPLPIS